MWGHPAALKNANTWIIHNTPNFESNWKDKKSGKTESTGSQLGGRWGVGAVEENDAPETLLKPNSDYFSDVPLALQLWCLQYTDLKASVQQKMRKKILDCEQTISNRPNHPNLFSGKSRIVWQQSSYYAKLKSIEVRHLFTVKLSELLNAVKQFS